MHASSQKDTSRNRLPALIVSGALAISAYTLAWAEDELPTVTIASTGMNFEMPESLPSGWVRLRYENRSPVTHFVALQHLPEGRIWRDSVAQVVPAFQAIMGRLLMREDPAEAVGRLPEWFFEASYRGGPGLVSPGNTAETLTYLEPGEYTVECYMKTPTSVFHSTAGMITGVTVTEAGSGAVEPVSDYRLSLSSERGIEFDSGLPRSGMRTFEVLFVDQKAWAHFLGHDVHLARLTGAVDIDALVAWMDWRQPTGLIDGDSEEGSTLPQGVEWLGGVQDMPAGSTAYFTVDLRPGRYALIAEVPAADEKGMLVEFSVPADLAGLALPGIHFTEG